MTWPQWRGPRRDGLVPSLPATLPTQSNIIWRCALSGSGLGGIAATDEWVLFGDRNLNNTHDRFQCLSAEDGLPLWKVEYEATGELDYGNSPRATPLIHDGLVFCFGAFGDLSCVDLKTGLVLWRKNIRKQFGATYKLKWGTCSSPLIVDDMLIVNPGAPEASIVALEPETGDVIWKTAGTQHAYASFIVATFGGVKQIVGYDNQSLGGWEIASGKRLWKLVPDYEHDFNVPTPQAIGNRLFVATENNGARLFRFEDRGRIVPKPMAVYEDLAPDMSSPVVLGDRLFCIYGALYCLDLGSTKNGLRELWIGEDDALPVYGAAIGGKERVLVVGFDGELLLIDARANQYRVLSRLKPFGNDGKNVQTYSHPALVGTRLYMRGESELICLELDPNVGE